MEGRYKNLSIRTFLTLDPYEKDKEFRELLGSIAREGMFYLGLLGAIAVVIYTSSHILLLGKKIVWHYSVTGAEQEVMLVDKGLILVLCLTVIPLSRTTISIFWSRMLIFVFVWLISLAILIDDIAVSNLTVSPEYISFVLIIAAAGMPFRGWQTALLNLLVVATSLAAVHMIPILFNQPALNLLLSQVIYLGLVAIVLTGISSLIYLSRYEQYSDRKRTEQLKLQLEERAHTLEILKAKSDRQAKKIREHEQLKDRFFANISHEFRTPLTLILGPLKDLLSPRYNGKKREVDVSLLNLMQKNGVRLLQLINQLLDLSKIDAGEIQLDLHPADLSALASDTILSFAPLAEAKKIKLTCHLTDKPLTINVDQQRMEQAIGNLVSNAVKFTPEGGIVDVSVARSALSTDSIQIKVSDTGIGIQGSDLLHIFDRFYQASQTSNSLNPGTGIGLALVKEIVKLHGGTLHVKSTPGNGSEFVIELVDNSGIPAGLLPAIVKKSGRKFVERDNEDWLITEESNEALTDDAPTVLVVDDNPDILVYLQGHLSRWYHVITLENSSKAIEIMREKSVDLLISDVMMPDPDGFELCRSVKQDAQLNHIPVILLTARVGEESKLEGLELGADDYICKPFSASELMVRIENLIELRRMLREKFTQQIRIEGRKAKVSSADARFLKQVQAVIEEHMESVNFGVDWMADELFMSPRHLQRKIRLITNLSAAGYIRFMRLERASQLLSQKWGNVSEVSYKVGFQDTKYFSRLFKQTFGVIPTEFAGKVAGN